MPQFVVQISGVFSFSETHWICLAKDAHHTPLVNKNEQTQKEIVINKQIRLNLIYTGGGLHFKKYFYYLSTSCKKIPFQFIYLISHVILCLF